jgi:hypothetical protein
MRKLKFRLKNSTIFHIKKNLSHRVGAQANIHAQIVDKQLFCISSSIGKTPAFPLEFIRYNRCIVYDIVNRYAADKMAQKYKIAVT